MTPIPPDLQQNLAITAELTILHNFWALLYFVGFIFSIIWSFFRPSRAATLAFVGFGLLLFSFEYTKHILEPFRSQTMTSIITEQQHLKVQRIIDISLIKLIPKGSYVLGWISLLSSSFLYLTSKSKNKK
ncbi:MAG: hypothetical protein ABIO02_05070 [Patescibacteria group bacterium]